MRPPAAAVASMTASWSSRPAVPTCTPKVIGARLSRASWRRRDRNSARSAGSSERAWISSASSNTPPTSPTTSTSLRTSSHTASREATGRSSDVVCVSAREVVKPTAPAARASRSSRSMAARSSSVAAPSKARSPITHVRSAEWPMFGA